MNHDKCGFKRFLVGYSIVLLITLLIIGLISFASSIPIPLRATMSVDLANTSDKTIYKFQAFFYVQDYQNASRVRFFNITHSPTHVPNGTLIGPIEDGSGFTIYIPEWSPIEDVQFQVYNISIRSDFPMDFSSLSYPKISHDIPNGSRSFEVSATLSLIGRTFFGTRSIASLHQFTYKGIIQPVEMRTQTQEYSKGFFVFLYFFMLLIPLSIWSPKSRKRLPFLTLVLVLLIVSLYAFTGSGREIYSMPPFAYNFFKIWPLGFLMHVSDDHLFGNLAIFIPLSLLLEVWLNVKVNWRRFATWYVLPILLIIFLALPRAPGIGFSIANEFLAWALWGLIIVDRKTRTSVRAHKLDVLLCLFSGVMAETFFGWLFEYLPYVFSDVASTYWGLIAQMHIVYGLIGAVIFAVITWFKSKRQTKDLRSYAPE